MNDRKKLEMLYRKPLMDFYSSELSTHSRLIAGFSALLFTLVVIIRELNKNVYVKGLAFILLGILSFGLWYLILRHFTYGVLANASIKVSLTNIQPEKLDIQTVNDAIHKFAKEKKFLLIFRYKWFAVGEDKKAGVAICMGFAVLTVIIAGVIINFG